MWGIRTEPYRLLINEKEIRIPKWVGRLILRFIFHDDYIMYEGEKGE